MSALLVFGSINLDIAVRVPCLPQAGETSMGGALRFSPGGKGANQAHAAARYGAAVRLVGAVGDDDFATAALGRLALATVDMSGVRRVPGAATGVALIQVADDGENTIVVAAGANDEARAAWVGDEVVARTRVLLLQLEAPPAQSLELARRVKACGGRVMWNFAPMREPAGLEPGCIDWLVVNRGELLALARAMGLEASSPDAALGQVAARARCTVIVTLGAQGAVACSPAGERIEVAGLPTPVVDTTGAGDTFCGVLAAALDELGDLRGALLRANAAASLACRAAGAQDAQPGRADIEAAVR